MLLCYEVQLRKRVSGCSRRSMDENSRQSTGDRARAMVYVIWNDEEYQEAGGQARRARVAWLARDVEDADGPRRHYLAYLGRRPMVTADLIWEMRELYPDLEIDWDVIRRELWHATQVTDVGSLTDDELATRIRALARERGLSLLDVGARITTGSRNVAAELEHVLRET